MSLTNQGVACGSLSSPARLFNASLERCLQRCRDTVAGCTQIEYHSAGGRCAVGVTSGGCGVGWSTHTVPVGCGYGRGRSTNGGSCNLCQEGTASHADVGDLAGTWNMQTVTGQGFGTLKISASGEATYSQGNLRGQFVLWHAPSDSNYPGAFYMKHLIDGGESRGGAGWDYAWVEEDLGSQTPRIVVRRFCGSGPVACQKRSSPEGSPFFSETLVSAGGICSLTGPTSSSISAQCCQSATAVKSAQAEAYEMMISTASKTWAIAPIVSGDWMTALSYPSWQGAAMALVSRDDAFLCLPPQTPFFQASENVVALVLRGRCGFANKTKAAHGAGAKGVIIANSVGAALPGIMGGGGAALPIPGWMINASVGTELFDLLNRTNPMNMTISKLARQSRAQASDLRTFCCDSSCKQMVSASPTAASGFDVSGVCSAMDCSGYQVVTTTTAVKVPRSGSTTCASCSGGTVATVTGRASCSLCQSGEQGSSSAKTCVACPAGRAGLFGSCQPCGSGMVQDVFRRRCETAPQASPTPRPTLPPTPTPTVSVVTGGNRVVNVVSGGGAATNDSFNWTPIIVVMLLLGLLAGGAYFFKRWVEHNGGNFAINFGNINGRNTDADDQEEEEGDKDKKNKKSEKEGKGESKEKLERADTKSKKSVDNKV